MPVSQHDIENNVALSTNMITRAELEQERQRYFDLFEFAPDGYIVTDLNGKIFEANHTAATLLNISGGFLIGKPLTVFIKLPERNVFRLNLARLRTERGKWDWITVFTPRRRSHFTAHLHAAPVVHDAHEITAIRWSIRDVTSQKNLEDKLRTQSARLQALSRHLVEAQEIERRQLARDLHDEIGQLLTGLKLTLEVSQNQPEAAPRHIANALGLIDGLMTQVRRLSLDLRPPMLDDLGLLASLHWSFERYTAQTGIAVTFMHSGMDRRFPPAIEISAYRIVQEALTNVARYAAVREVSVRVIVNDKAIYLHVEDTGRGFDIQASLQKPVSSGLTGLYERAALVGGSLQIESTPDKGTRLSAELPLGNAKL